MTKRVVITGAPGTGKSTILHLLENRGFTIHSEMARALIAEQQALESELLPWENHAGFGLELFKRQKEQYFNAEDGVYNFYDRGVPDNLGYLRRDKLQNTLLEEEAAELKYHQEVFLTPPWEEIYGNDEVRWEDTKLMLEIHEALKDIYNFYGYQITEVPKLSPEERVLFILNRLGLRERNS
jgi:predicted ATPase